MAVLERMDEERLALAIHRLRHPLPGSKIEAARDFGIDLSLLVEQLRLTPGQRATSMHAAAKALEQTRGAARRACAH